MKRSGRSLGVNPANVTMPFMAMLGMTKIDTAGFQRAYEGA